MKPGHTFYINRPDITPQAHLWVVLSDPDKFPEAVVIVSITSGNEDPACLLNVNDHPWIRNLSHVSYGHWQVVLRQKLLDPNIAWREPLPGPVFDRLVVGLQVTQFMREKIRIVLREQGLIPPLP